MIELKKLDREQMWALAPYFAVQKTHISDYSLGFQFMWSEALSPDFCFAGNCLVLHEFYSGCNYFYYPISLNSDPAEEEAALDEIESYCREKDLRLHFTNIPEAKVMTLLKRYGQDCTINNRRRWRDYLYNAEDFQAYGGKKYAGQRNHVNKFLKLYSNWEFHIYQKQDESALIEFLDDISLVQKSKGAFLAKEEMDETLALIPKIHELNMVCGLLKVEGKIVGASVGEVCGDMLVVHIEKARRDYEGAYPFLAQQFARAFCGDGVKFLNRMDDAGDLGLRKSKLQYLPCELVGKYNVLPKRAIDLMSKLPEIETERLTLAPVRDEDAAEYARLARDVERNRYWGYDWRTDHADGVPSDEYFLKLAREDFRRKDELSLGIFLEEKLVGEVVLHRFGYRANVELGVRLLPEAEGNGYASEAMNALASYAFLKLNMEVAEAKCYRENQKSDKMLRAAGFRPCGLDDTFYYYQKTPSM